MAYMFCSGEQDTTATTDGAASESTTTRPPDPGCADTSPKVLKEGSAMGRLLRSQRETSSTAAAPLTPWTSEAAVAAHDSSCRAYRCGETPEKIFKIWGAPGAWRRLEAHANKHHVHCSANKHRVFRPAHRGRQVH